MKRTREAPLNFVVADLEISETCESQLISHQAAQHYGRKPIAGGVTGHFPEHPGC